MYESFVLRIPGHEYCGLLGRSEALAMLKYLMCIVVRNTLKNGFL
jgi:hypothetical protein